MGSENLDKLKVNNLKPIDAQDTINELISKLNHNFSIITDTGIFNIEEEIPEDNHDYLCDALLIKPHQPIHRRKRVLDPLENRTDISWLSNVDYLYGDIAIVEQKRIIDSTKRVYMYTITKDKTTGDTILAYETELTGPEGKSGEIYLTYSSQEIFENTHFNKLNVDKLIAHSISLSENSSITASEIITNKLTIGNLTFYNNNGYSELGSNALRVGTVYGFKGATDTITFGSPIIINHISSSDDVDAVSFETAIKVDKISSFNVDNPIIFGSELKSNSDVLKIQSKIGVNEISSYDIDGKISFKNPIKVDTISSDKNDGKISFKSTVIIDKIETSGEKPLILESTITTNKDELNIICNTNFDKNVKIDSNLLDFKHFNYNDKHHIPGQIFLAIDKISKDINTYNKPLKKNSDVDFSRLGTPYSFVPINENKYYIAKVNILEKNTTHYMLITPSSITNKGDKVRIVTTKNDIVDTNIKDEHVYELIASNDIYEDIFNNLQTYTPSTSKKYITIGLVDPSEYGTYMGCSIELRDIPTFVNNTTIGTNTKAIYHMTLY